MQASFLRLAAALIIAVLYTTVFSACGGRALQVEVPRPAAFNVREHGGTLTVAPFAAANPGWIGAAALVQQELRQRILETTAPIQLVEGNGAVIVHGTVADYSYMENRSQTADTCYRYVSSGGSSTRVPYTCYQNRRDGQARVAITFTVTLADGRSVFARTYSDQASDSTYATNAEPPFIDGDGMLARMRVNLTEDFSRVILPWNETIRVRLTDCKDATKEFCENGWALMDSGDFAGAVAQFQQAVNAGTQSNLAPEDQASVLFNLARAHEFSGDFDAAQSVLQQAMALKPNDDAMIEEQQRIEELRANMMELQSQGVQ